MNSIEVNNKDGETTTEEGLVEKPGALLKAAREREGLSLDKVAETLYISRSKVRALEEDEYDKLHSHVFIKGYLRKYAPLVGLDGDGLVDRYQKLMDQMNATLESFDEKDEEIPSTLIPKFVVPAALFGLAAIALITIFVFYGSDGGAAATAVTPASDVDETLIEQVIAGNRLENASLDRELAAEARALTAIETPVASAPENKPIAAQLIKNNATGTELVGDSSELKFEFSEDCWLEVRDSIDTILYTDVAKAGESFELQGEPPFSISMGNAQAVTLYWGDEVINTQPRPGNRTAKIIVGEETATR